MPIAITDDHRRLAGTVVDFTVRRHVRRGARALLDGAVEESPAFWGELAGLGWLGLHIPEDYGGSGYGPEELVVVVESLGAVLAPGGFVPTTIVSRVIAAAADEETKTRLLPGLVDGSVVAGVSLGGSVEVAGAVASGSAATVLGGNLADLIMVPAGDDVVVVSVGDGVRVEIPPNLDPTRGSARVYLDRAAVTVLSGARGILVDTARMILSAEAVGMAAECTRLAAEYAKTRLQFGRPIGTYQAVKHHCANMAVATELATSAVWDAARAAALGGDQFSYAAAVAATLAAPAADLCTNLHTQVHGGIAMTWEHDAHLYVRRATTLLGFLDPDAAARDLTDFTRAGLTREKTIHLPPEAEQFRKEVKEFADSIKGLPRQEQRRALIDTGYVMPHWPKPHGRAAGAVEQLVIEQEFTAAAIRRPSYSITGWVILTLIQHGTDEQIARWVEPALNREVIWCQLFSEPEAGSDAAGIKTKATRVNGGWLINGQKLWTSGAHVAGMGFATVRTNPDVPKHEGITIVVIDMHTDGVEVRPLKTTTGDSDFNEVFFNDVFVPDDDVVGPVDGGWAVARATLGNESVSIGSGEGAMTVGADVLVKAFDANPDRLDGGAARVGRYAAVLQAMGLLNLRSAHRAVAGAEPGPEGAITKLAVAEAGHEVAAILAKLNGPEVAFMDGSARLGNTFALMHRAASIAGGTSEIKRNQIGERILGLPRDPLIN